MNKKYLALTIATTAALLAFYGYGVNDGRAAGTGVAVAMAASTTDQIVTPGEPNFAQGDKIRAEVSALAGSTSDSIKLASKIAEVTDKMVRGGTLPSECFATSSTVATCIIQDMAARITLSSSTQGTWVAGNAATGTMTTNGVIAYANGAVTLNGYLPTVDAAHKLRLGRGSDSDKDLANETALVISRQSQGGDVHKYSFEGVMAEIDGANKAVSGIAFAAGSNLVMHEPLDERQFDAGKVSMNLTGSFTSSNYRLTGEVALSNMKSAIRNGTYLCGWNRDDSGSVTTPVICLDHWARFTGGTGSFRGTISGHGLEGVDVDKTNDFDILAGKADFMATPTAAYNPNAATTATNMIVGTATFTGTAKRSATDSGLKLVLTASNKAPDGGAAQGSKVSRGGTAPRTS
jgi:hypothetical protein